MLELEENELSEDAALLQDELEKYCAYPEPAKPVCVMIAEIVRNAAAKRVE